jgi:hypothetical protein
MPFEKTPVFLTEKHSFEAVLNTTCERLEEKHLLYSLRRIREMDGELAVLEAELDEFMGASSIV